MINTRRNPQLLQMNRSSNSCFTLQAELKAALFFLSKGSVAVRHCSGAQTFVTHLNSSLFNTVIIWPRCVTFSSAWERFSSRKPVKYKGNCGKSHNRETVQKCHHKCHMEKLLRDLSPPPVSLSLSHARMFLCEKTSVM